MRKEFILVASVILLNLLLVSADTTSTAASIGVISSKDQWVYDISNSNLQVYFLKPDDKNSPICLYNEKDPLSLKPTITLYDKEAKATTELRLETFKLNGRDTPGYCYTPRDETYLNFDDSVVISFDKPQYVKYETKDVSIDLTLLKEGFQFSDVWANETTKTYKFGAEDKYNKGLKNYTYLIKTSTPIISADKPYTYRTYSDGFNIIEERHLMDFSDICNRGFDCTTKQGNYYSDGENVTFNYTSCKDYPDCELKYIDDYTLEVSFKSDHFIDPTITISNIATADANYLNVTPENNFTHLNISTSPPYNDLVVYYSFDQNDLDYCYDYSKNQLDGSVNSSYGWNNTAGYIGGGYNYMGISGSADYITVADNPLLDFPTNSFSISLWAKTSGLGTIQPLIDKLGTKSGYKLYIGTAGYLNANINDTTHPNIVGLNSAIPTPIMVADGSWHHFVAIFNRTGNLSIYIDNILANSINITNASSDISSTNNLYIGYNPITGNLFQGNIDELMIFNTSLTTSQISDIYNNISARFVYNGTQSFNNQTSLNLTPYITSGRNRIVIQGEYQNYQKSNISLQLGYFNSSNWLYTSPQIFNGSNSFLISNITTYLTLNFTLLAGNSSNPFYSPTLVASFNISNYFFVILNLTFRNSLNQQLIPGVTLIVRDSAGGIRYTNISNSAARIQGIVPVTLNEFSSLTMEASVGNYNSATIPLTLNSGLCDDYTSTILLAPISTGYNPSTGGSEYEIPKYPRNDTPTPPIVIGNVSLPSVCGNGKCEWDETFKTCESDCGKLTLDSLIFSCLSKDAKEKQKCILFNSPVLFWLGLGAILLGIGAFGTTQVVRRRKKKAPKKFYKVPQVVVQSNGNYYKLSPVARQMIKNG